MSSKKSIFGKKRLDSTYTKFSDSNESNINFLNANNTNSNYINSGYLSTSYALFQGPVVYSNSETIEGDGSGKDALSITKTVSYLDTSSGTSDLTLAAGTNGQIKIITMTASGNNAVLDTTDGNLVSTITSITWDAVGESVILMYNGSNWTIIGQYGVTIA